MPSAYSFVSEVLPGIEYRVLSAAAMNVSVGSESFPQGFPIAQMNEQLARYSLAWYWYTGKALEEVVEYAADGEPIYRYPLRINPLRTFSRVHNAMLFGEMGDGEKLPIDFRCKAKPHVHKNTIDETAKANATFAKNVINKIWMQSNGRALLQEGGLLSQFLGGVFIQYSYQPFRKDLQVPITLKLLPPDFVIPIPDPDSSTNDLLEAYIAYRIPVHVASKYYGVDVSKGSVGYVAYVEHWTKTEYSIYVNGKPLTATYNIPGYAPYTVTHKNQPNRFGFVPITYIPRLKEGDFFGSSITADVLGLIQEYNLRFADIGDIVSMISHPRYFGRNIQTSIKPKNIDNGIQYYDLGVEIPSWKTPPHVWMEQATGLSEPMLKLLNLINGQMLQEGFISPIAFGVDEGSQRSGTTLQIRMFPTIATARAQRTNWSMGLRTINYRLLEMVKILGIDFDGRKIDDDIIKNTDVVIKWPPYIPRDEEQAINTLVLSKQSNIMSTYDAVSRRPDVEDVEEEYKRILEEEERALENARKQQQSAATQVEEPVARSDTSDQE